MFTNRAENKAGLDVLKGEVSMYEQGFVIATKQILLKMGILG